MHATSTSSNALRHGAGEMQGRDDSRGEAMASVCLKIWGKKEWYGIKSDTGNAKPKTT
jgi:hypothetical protein